MKRAKAWLLLGIYRLLSLGLTPFWLVLLLVRLAKAKEDPRRLGERLGWPSRRRPAGPLLWFHAASVGELNSLLPVLRALDQGVGAPVLLVTTVTRTSAALADRVLPPAAIHQFVPIDHWLALLPFRCYWRPCLGVLAEAELWPELVQAMPHLYLINARMSQRSYLRHRRFPVYAGWLLARVEVCLAQSQDDGERFRRLGARDVRALGSTKLDADPPPVNSVHLELVQQVFAGRSVLLLASSHAGEERQWLEAWVENKLTQRPFGLLLAPRHPQRAQEVLAQARELGLSAALWSDLAGGGLAPNPDVLVADVIGEMGTWISAAAVVVMGGSFYPQGRALGGQNPLEPVALGRPVLCGPDMANFSDLLEPLLAAGCLQQCADVAAALAAALPLLVQPLPQRRGEGLRLRGPSQLLASLLLKQCR